MRWLLRTSRKHDQKRKALPERQGMHHGCDTAHVQAHNSGPPRLEQTPEESPDSVIELVIELLLATAEHQNKATGQHQGHLIIHLRSLSGMQLAQPPCTLPTTRPTAVGKSPPLLVGATQWEERPVRSDTATCRDIWKPDDAPDLVNDPELRMLMLMSITRREAAEANAA